MRALLLVLTLALFGVLGCSPVRMMPSEAATPLANARTRILLTNDDGIDAPGILALRRELERHSDRYDVTVVAPISNRSGSGMAKSHDDVALVQHGPHAYAVHGTPADCVIVALGGVLRERPDLVVSGMNYGANLGRVALMSGTVGAAMTAASMGVPAIAVSVGTWETAPERMSQSFQDAAELTEKLIRTVATHPGWLAPGRVLSVNYPAVAREKIRGVKATSQASLFSKNRTYTLIATPMLRPGDRRFVLVRTGGVRPADLGTEDQDVRAFDAGWVTVTPMDGDWTVNSELPAVSDLLRALPSSEPRP